MLITIYAAIVGLLIGSAINAIVWRLYVGRKWTRGRSICPECEHKLAPKDLVPVVSWVLLRGRCRYCRAPIKDSPIVEAVTALLFGLSAAALPHATLGHVALFVAWLVLLTLLIILAVYDLRWLILPDKIMLPAIVVAAIIVAGNALLAHSWLALRGPVLAAVVAGGFFYSIVAISRGRAMGGGDIKFVFMMGLLLGLKGTLLGLVVAFDVAAVVAVVLIVLRRRGRRDQIAFGPFLAAATVAVYLYGHSIINWYLQLNGLT